MNTWLMIIFIILAFFLNIFGLMHLIPLYITSPILFISVFIFFHHINGRNRFKGY